MSEIDWSKAPEWATHAITTGPKWDGTPELKGRIQFARLTGVKYVDYSSWDEATLMMGKKSWVVAQERPTNQWSGTGLPPVGTCVEMVNDKDYMVSDHGKQFIGEPCVVMAAFINSQGYDMVAVEKDDGACFCFRADMCRPIRTEAQIAAEEREKVVSNMADTLRTQLGPSYRDDIARLYSFFLHDAGYRKQEPKP